MPLAGRSIIANEKRLAALRSTCLLDTPVDPTFDRLTRLATRILNAPVSLVSLVDENRQFLKSQVGLPEPYATIRETPLTHSFCQHTVATNAPLVVTNAREHPLVYDNLAIDDLNVIAYAGIPLVTSSGEVIGSFCVIDSQPRIWKDSEIEILSDLAKSVMTEVELQTELRERERITRELDTSRRFLDGVLNMSPIVVFLFDLELDRLIYVNNAVTEIFGYPVEPLLQMTGKELASLCHIENPTMKNEAQKNIGTVKHFVSRMRHANGDLMWVDFYFNIYKRDSEGKPSQMLATAVDVTAHKEIERKQIQLQMEKERVNLMREFIAITSHDLGTPLTMIQMSIDLMRMTNDQSKLPMRLNVVEEQVSQIKSIIDQFFELATLDESVKQEMRTEDLSRLAQIAAHIVVGKYYDDTNYEFESILADEPLRVRVDPYRMQLAIVGIVENAYIYSPNGGKIRLTTRREGQYAVVEVIDSGIGISEDERAKIFLMFYKANEARTHNRSKAGLGLTMVKRVVELHNGRIEVESKQGAGSTFRIRLPLAEVETPEVNTASR